MILILSSFLGHLSKYMIPCIILALIEYLILLKYPKYNKVLLILSFIYGLAASIRYLMNISLIAQSVPYYDHTGYFIYSILNLITYFSIFIVLIIIYKIFNRNKKDCKDI